MKSLKYLITVSMMILFASIGFAADTTKTLTFLWEHTQGEDNAPVVNWELYWGVTAGGPYVKLADIPYQDAVNGTYQSPTDAVVTGQAGTHETRYFTLKACGNVTLEDNSVEYQCSDPSNEISHDFFIAAAGYSAPFNFRIQEEVGN